MAQLMTVRLNKSDHQPLGFRLQGGKDFGTPLVVQKVSGGSAAERAGLLAGDALIRVNSTDVYCLRHQEAQDAIKNSGPTLELTVQRGGSTWKPSVTPTGSLPRPNSRPLGGTPSPVTTTSLKATPQPSRAFGSGHNNVAKPFGYMNGSDSVKGIVNKQYNTPVNMYSDQSIAETLSAQTEVLAGGVLGVNFKKNEKTYDAEKSAVFKVLQEEQNDPEPEVVSAGANPTVAGLRHVQAPVTRPDAPINNTGGLPPGQNICEDCERLITGVFVRIKDKNLHVECFKCATCGSSLKNQGYYNLNGKLYCDIHAKLVARQNPPAANLEPVTVPPGGRIPSNYSTPLPPLSTNTQSNGSSMFSPSSNISGPKPFSSSMGSAYSPSLSPRSAPMSPSRPVVAPVSTHIPAPAPTLAPAPFTPTNECVIPNQKPQYKSAAEERLIRKMAKMALNGYEIGIQRKLKPAEHIQSMADKIQDTVVTKHPLNSDIINNETSLDGEFKKHQFRTNESPNKAEIILNIGDMIKETIMSKHPAFNKASLNSPVPPPLIPNTPVFPLTPNIPIPPPIANSPVPPPIPNTPVPPPIPNTLVPPPILNTPVPPPIPNTPVPPPIPNTPVPPPITNIPITTLISKLSTQNPNTVNHPPSSSIPIPPPMLNTLPSSNIPIPPPISNAYNFSNSINNNLVKDNFNNGIKPEGILINPLTEKDQKINNENNTMHPTAKEYVQHEDKNLVTNNAYKVNGNQDKPYNSKFNGFDKTDAFEKSITSDFTSTPKADLNKPNNNFSNTLQKRKFFEKNDSDTKNNTLKKNIPQSNIDVHSNVLKKVNSFEKSSNSNSEKSYSSDEENKKPSLNLHDNSLYNYKPVKLNGTNNFNSADQCLNGNNHQNNKIIEETNNFTNGDSEWSVKRREKNVDRTADGKRDSHIIARPKSTITSVDVTDGMLPICNVCEKEITRGPFITALGRIWCPDHFVCVNATCRRQLQDIGFVEENGQLYCEFCFEQYIAPSCDKCHAKIKGDCLNAIGKHFHPECFNCVYCGKLFGNNPFFLEDGLPYCESDWNELFTTKCFACGFPVEAGDRWVEALNNNYHSQCFNCTVCKRNLEGQSFFAKGGRPFCKQHAR